jgi:hypothetical protein
MGNMTFGTIGGQSFNTTTMGTPNFNTTTGSIGGQPFTLQQTCFVNCY